MMKRLQKMISIVMAVIVIATGFTIPVSANSGYTDVSTSDSCYNAVIYLRDHNIMVGQTSTYFGKNNTLIRADVVSILWRMLNMPEPYGMISSFPDCDPNAYYYKAVQWACSESVGIASGYENGNFGPTDLVSNQDLLTFLYRFACYCGYEENTSSNQEYYKSIFNNSSLIFKSSFWEYSKVAVGWAYSLGFVTNYSVQGTAAATRGNTAIYVYDFYKCFQRKFGLSIVNTTNLSRASFCASGMRTLFDRCGAESIGYQNISESSMLSKMNNAFENATPFDICYLYLHSHGNGNGLALFTNNDYLSPIELRNYIKTFKGTFIVFIHGCQSGVYIDSASLTREEFGKDENGSEVNLGEFDVYAFIDELVGNSYDLSDSSDALALGSRALTNDCYIKTLASCESDESSWAYLAASYWCMGAGQDINTGADINMYADSNGDGRISLYELYCYSYINIEQHYPEQHVDYHPEFDSYIIFEKNY